MKTINEVMPIEMLEEVFSYLSIGEKLRCRSVCKLWNTVLSNMRLANLTVIWKNPYKRVNSRDSNVYEPTKNVNLIELASDDCFSNLSKEAIFQNVRHLTTFFSNMKYIYHLQNFYNQFVKLESLVIGSNFSIQDLTALPSWYPKNNIFVLKLSCLKKLTVDTDFFNFFLRTPELLYLKSVLFPFFIYFSLENPVYRDKLKVLDIDLLSSSFLEDYEFPSLEILIFRQQLKHSHLKDHRKLFTNQNLKEVHLCGPAPDSGYPEDILRILSEFREQNGKRFEMFVYGISYGHYKNLPEKQRQMFWLWENTTFLVQNRSLMAETVYSKFTVQYCQLEHLSDEELDQFARKFQNIGCVSVDRNIANEERLLKFLEKQSKPAHLEFKHFNQHNEQFLNQLGSRCRFLRALTIRITSRISFENFGFLFKLENLTCLKFLNAFSLELAIRILKQVQSLKDLRFHTKPYQFGMVVHWYYQLKIVNEFRMNGLCLYRKSFAKSKCFSNKADCIQFLGELASKEPRIDLTRFFELLPDNPECQFYGYLSFPN